ncbi:hypothetical protein [Streptomyces sp. NPDC050548]|uniref:hypothetical protein n=1 Tax=Streptomyces sp. NPDC050548 TaxID=3365629 RepID=UPI0037914D73
MRLTWRDAVTSLFMAAIVVIYVAYLRDTGAWLVSSTRGTATAVLVLGAVGGCSLGRIDELFTGSRSRTTRIFTLCASLLGVTALSAAIIALVAANAAALAVLFAATMALWVASTVRHALTPAPGPGTGVDARTHEAIDHRPAHH